MSIVIALGVTTPETSYSDMAAGSDPESVEASPAVNEKNYSNHSCGSAQSHGYRGLPYAMQQSSVVCCQDHNYGAPPPPTPPASPLSQTIIPRMELNGVVRGSRYHQHQQHHVTAEDNSADSDSSSDEEEEEEEEEGGVADWCPCSLTQDGLLGCENCRGLDRRKGVEGQRRKPENVSVGESSATESGDEEVSPPTVSYIATQHTPTSITLTVNRVKRNKSKKRKKSTEKTRGTPKGKKVKAFREGSRKSMRMKNSMTEANVLDENTAEGWETKIRQWTDQYEEAVTNQYSADVQTLLQLHRTASATVTKTENSSGTTPPPLPLPSPPAPTPLPPPPPPPSSTTTTTTTQADTLADTMADTMDTINRTELACNNTVLGSQMQLQLGRVTRVQKHRKILRAAKTLEPDALVIEYRGKVMLKQQFEVNGHFFKKPYPFVLFYSKFNAVEMCVDARTLGNDSRFIRRSCTPNAEVRHMIAEGMIHLCIYAVSQITKDAEVTIGFDYEFSSCNYKVDCACRRGNQSCPVQKHNQSPRESLLCPPSSLPPPSSLLGAETRRRKARRRELEGGGLPPGGGTSDDQDRHAELQGASDAEEGLLDGLKQEEGEEGEVDENGVLLSSRRERKAEALMQAFDSLERRRRKPGGGGGVEESRQEVVEAEEGAVHPITPPGTAAGITTRRTTYVTEPLSVDVERIPLSSVAALSAPAGPPKPPPARSTKPRPKSRISRYRSNSSQRARRQRQALAQQAAAVAAAAAAAAAAEQGATLAEEGPQGPPGAEPGLGEGGLGVGQFLDVEGQGPAGMNRGHVRYPKTKKYLVTEWLNDKIPGGERAQQEVPVERPLRITTDPTVLATTLNMLPGLAHSPLICTAPKHYVRFGSPFNPERRRPRPLQMDGTYGCYKKRWIKQAEDESCSASLEDGSESTSSHQSTSSRSTPNPLSNELNAPFKKRRSKYASDAPPTSSEHLLRPLSPITPPLPGDPLLGGASSLLPNGLAFSPLLPSLPTSRCNTPLQFENISSPEASPVHRPDSISPEPCLRTDFDTPRAQFPDLSLPSSLESPLPATLDDFSLPGGAPGHDSSQGPASLGGHTPAPCPLSDPSLPHSQSREQAFRTEFNLIYTCSPLNANLGNPAATDRRLSQSEGSFSPGESFYNAVSGQGLLGEAGPGSMSPYGEPHYGGSYPDSGTPPHASNPPQKKKRANQHTVSLLTGKPDYQAIAVRSEYKPVQNMVSLLEYRKRKQGSGRDPEAVGAGSSLGSTPTRSESHHHPHGPPQPPASPHSSFSSPAHPSSSSSSIPQIEEVSPPDQHHHQHLHHQHPSTSQASSAAQARSQDNSSHWMVPTSVERLREGQGVLERVLRGSIKMERMMKRSEGLTSADKDPDADRYDIQAVSMASPRKSPHRYSPSVYSQQSTDSQRQTDSPSFLQQSASSPFRGSYSPSNPPSSGQSFYPRHPGLSQDYPSPSSYASQTTAPTTTISSSDSRPPGGALLLLHQQSGTDSHGGGHLKASLLNSSGSAGSPTPAARGLQAKTDSGAPPSSRPSPQQQQAAPRGLKTGSSPGQAGQAPAVLQGGSTRLLASGTAAAPHYPRGGGGAPLGQFQHPPLQGSGVRTQSGSF